jgi:hypothetical protein
MGFRNSTGNIVKETLLQKQIMKIAKKQLLLKIMVLSHLKWVAQP